MTENRPVVVLTPRQHTVLRHLLRDGGTNAEIAARLGLSAFTVKTHIKGICKAFGISNRTAIVVQCLRGRVLIREENHSGDYLHRQRVLLDDVEELAA